MFTTTPGFPRIDATPVLAETMRRRLFDRAVSDKALVTGYHFPFPAVGKIVADGAGHTFVRRRLVSAVRKSSIGELGILTPAPRCGEKLTKSKSNKCRNACSRFKTHWISRKMSLSTLADSVVSGISRQILAEKESLGLKKAPGS
jgi:hypothetical protein